MWSFEDTGDNSVTTSTGAVVHKDHAQQSEVLARCFYTVRDGVWNLVGNGLSNQSFIEAPEGIIVIDTGESVEEMSAALRELRTRTTRPIAAVIYTHFHYIEGTQAIFLEGNHVSPLPIYGHPKIAHNRVRIATEISPAYIRGVVEQFAIVMPLEGPDANVNIGLGFHFLNPEHAPYTPGHIPCTRTFSDNEILNIAGLEVHVSYAPSDADDSVTLWFPRLELAIHNVVWPTLFNIFAIRGEEYRDPQILIRAVEHLLSLTPAHLVGTHGPPLSGVNDNVAILQRYRDSLSYLWDQTVRGINRGWTSDEIAERVRLPEVFAVDYLTSERYGVVEHHVRQIHNGLRGWFDGDESHLFPMAPHERHERLIAELGGRDSVRQKVADALAHDDVRWALELSTWLVRSPEVTAHDKQQLAKCLRTIASRTPSANVRNWCITRARHLDGTGVIDVLYQHRFNARNTESLSSYELLNTLRVLVDPQRVEGVRCAVKFEIDNEAFTLALRNSVSVIDDREIPTTTLSMTRETLNALFMAQLGFREARNAALIAVSGDDDALARFLSVYELDAFHS